MVAPTTMFVVLVLTLAACAQKQAVPVAQPTEPLVPAPDGPRPPPDEPAAPCHEVDADWPMFQRTPGRLGATPAPAIASPAVAWSAEIGIAGWLDNPIIALGSVFVPSSGQVHNRPDGSDGLYAFDLKTGTQQWFAPTADDANGAAYERCRVFVGSDAGTVSAVDARTAAVLWTAEFAGKMYANPLPLGDVVVVAGEPGVIALDVDTGKVVWQRTVGATVRGGAAADEAHVYVTTEAGRVVALARRDGLPVWSTEIQSAGAKSAYSAPTVANGKVYVAFVRDTYYGSPAVRAYDAASGDATWEATNTQNLSGGWGNIRSSPALHDGFLYWGEAYSNRLVSVDANSGDVASSVEAGLCTFPHWPSPAIAQEVVYVPRHDGGLYAYDIEAGKLRWSLFLGDKNSLSQSFPIEHGVANQGTQCLWDPPFGRPIYASPAVAGDGTVIVATGDGWLHAIRESP